MTTRIAFMEPTLLHDVPLDTTVATRLHLVASLIVDSTATSAEKAAPVASPETPKTRVLIQLARIGANSANEGDAYPVHTLGVLMSGKMVWNEVGHLDLDAHSIEHVLLSGLSALAMKHVREAGVQIGDAVLVFGADPWSLLLLQWARLQGASPLVFVGRGPQSLGEYASSVGAHLSDSTPGDLARATKLTHRAGGFVIALDAIANEQSMTQALSALVDGGRYMLAGIDPEQYVSLNAYPDLHRRDLEIVAPMHAPLDVEFTSLFRFSLSLAAEGRLQLDGLLDSAFGWHVVTSATTR